MCIVVYAANIASAGLDIATKGTRDEIWRKEKSLPLSSMDSSLPWYPEMAGYSVCEISVGKCIHM